MPELGHTITRLLHRWREGEDEALGELMPLVYDELRHLAVHYRGGDEGTLRPTALAHEAYLRFERHGGSFRDRKHFFAAAALTMRQLLVDHARSHTRQKRGGEALRVELSEDLVGAPEPVSEVLALDRALDRLAAVDPPKVRILELHCFGGLTYEEIAEMQGRSPATVGRDLRFAKAWLKRELAGEGHDRP